MKEENNISAPEPGKKEALKEYSFTRIINLKNKHSETPKDEEIQKEPKDSTTLNLIISLYPKEISISAKEKNKNEKLPNISYETNLSLETLQGYNKFFSILSIEKIFETIQKFFELNYDNMFLEEDKLVIKLMINFMEVVTEELTFELQKIKLSSEEESLLINESIKALTEEKNLLKNEVNSLNNTIAELKKISEEKNNELKIKIEQKENESKERENELKAIIEENKREFQNKLEEKNNELKNIIEEKNNELKNKLEEKNNEFKIILEKLQEEMKGVKEIEKYSREKIVIENKEEKEKNKKSFNRELKFNNNLFNMEITIFLYEDRIKFEIKEIQDNLKNNPQIYISYKKMEDFGRISDYYKNEGGIKSIYEFLIQLFEGKKDKIKKENNEIIIELNYTLGIKEDEITLRLSKKEIGLEATLNNIDKSLKEIIESKIEFKKDLLEKVYPIGSYYWSSSDISPQTLFGGIWTKIKGRFLFASDGKHSVGYEDGEEKHYLTKDEMPSHYHGYHKFNYDHYFSYNGENNSCAYYPYSQAGKFLVRYYTDSEGGGKAHNNMPPYLTANCWRRTG